MNKKFFLFLCSVALTGWISSAHANETQAFEKILTTSSDCFNDYDCGGGACREGKCSTSPGGQCYFDSDCPGGACRSGKCSNVAGGHCYFDSDCDGGSCRGGICSNN
jgi:hypothetical protein